MSRYHRKHRLNLFEKADRLDQLKAGFAVAFPVTRPPSAAEYYNLPADVDAVVDRFGAERWSEFEANIYRKHGVNRLVFRGTADLAQVAACVAEQPTWAPHPTRADTWINPAAALRIIDGEAVIIAHWPQEATT